MSRIRQVSDPVNVPIGSVWVPRYPRRGKQGHLKVTDCVQRPSGTHFVVESAGSIRLVSYKSLVAYYRPQ